MGGWKGAWGKEPAGAVNTEVQDSIGGTLPSESAVDEFRVCSLEDSILLEEMSWKFISVPGTVQQLLSLIIDSGCILVMGKALEDWFCALKKEAYVRHYLPCIQDILKFSFLSS